jgi:hypothetical protein
MNRHFSTAMQNTVRKYAIIGSAILGIATIILGIIMLFVFPAKAELSEGFRTPIIAFEFAKTEADLAFLSGYLEPASSNREKMVAGHRWDMLFPFAYAGFIALMLLQAASKPHRWLGIAIPLALLIIPFDIRENIVLLEITEALNNSDSIGTLLQELHLATWLKWGAIGVSIGALSVGFVLIKDYLSALLSGITSLGIAACWVTGAQGSVAETMSAVTSLFFFYFTVRAGIQAWNVFHPTT